MRSALLIAAAGVVAGCFAPEDAYTDEMPDDLPAGACRDTDADACATTSTGSTSSSSSGEERASSGSTAQTAPNECEGSDGCLGEDVCVAAWDGQARGAFVCQFTCIPTLDESAWCSDDASCCDPRSRCTARGYCVRTEDDASTG